MLYKHPILFYSIFLLSILLPYQTLSTVNPSNLRGNGIGFTENKGQIIDSENHLRPDILFAGSDQNKKIYLRESGISFVVQKSTSTNHENPLDVNPIIIDPMNVHRVDIDFIGSNENTSTKCFDQLEGLSNYFLAHCPEGITKVKSYNKILTENIYNNIDILYYGGKDEGLKYDIIVKPGGDPSQIKFQYKGASSIQLENKKLHIGTSLGELSEWMPKVYQDIDGKIITIECDYVLNGEILSFSIGEYNKNYSLIIDPWITYLGGNNTDEAYNIKVVGSNIVVNGETKSSNFPVNVGPAVLAGDFDAFVTKFDLNGNHIWSTFYGGTSLDQAKGIDTDGSNIFISGITWSSSLPMTAGHFQTTNRGGIDIFIAKFNAAGSVLWSSFCGGSTNENTADIAVDANGDAIIVGATTSTVDFPVTAGVIQPVFGGGFNDCFITKFSSTGNQLWATYYGGSLAETAYGVDVDAANNIFIAGYTSSSDFYASPGAHQTVKVGINPDQFLIKLQTTGTAAIWSTFYGNVGIEYGYSVAVDRNNDVVLGGYTQSASFPTTLNPPTASGTWDATLVKFSNTGTRLWATSYGGTTGPSVSSGNDYVTGIEFDNYNNVVTAGDTYSADFPVTSCAYQTVFAGTEDQFITVFNSSGTMICSGFLGSGTAASPNNETYPYGGSIDVSGGFLYLTGYTACNYQVTPGAFQTVCGGGTSDGFVAKLCITTCGNSSLAYNFSANNTSICVGESVNYTSAGTTCDTSNTTWNWTFSGGNPSISTQKNPSNIIYNAGGIYNVKLIVTSPCDTDTIIQNNYITVASPTLTVASIVNETCGNSNGVASVLATGGNGNYTYSWFPSGGTAAIASNLTAASYTITLTDGNSCTATTSLTINNQAGVTATVTPTHITCNGANNGTARAIASGGNGAYTYKWSNTQSAQTISNLSQGLYSITVTDGNNCSVVASATITEPTTITTTVTSNSVSCYSGNNGTASVVAAGGIPPYSYLWNTNETTISISNLVANTYTVTVRDMNGCKTTTTIIVSQPSALSTTVSATNVSCNGGNNGTSIVNVSGGNSPYTYNWTSVTGGGQAGQTATNLIANTYSITITDANNCTTTNTVTVSQPTPLSTTITATAVTCNGGNNASVNVNITGGTSPYNFSWSNTATSQGVNNLIAGIYSVTITDFNNCVATNTIQVSQPSVLTATVSSTDVSCNGSNNGTARVLVNGGISGYNYLWNNNQTTSIATGLTSGIYSVTVTDNNGCTITTNTTVSQPSLITLTTTSAPSHCNQSDGGMNVNSSGGTGIHSYLWNTIPSSTSANATGIPAGNYQVTVTDANGCTQTGNVIVINNSGVTAQAVSSSSVTCFGLCNGNATANGIGGTQPYTYSWNNNQTNSSATGLCAGSYTATITDANGCTSDASFIIKQPIQLSANITTTSITCNGYNDGSATVQTLGGNPTYFYQWNNNQNMATATNLSAGIYSVTITDVNNCSATAAANIIEPTAIQINISMQQQICFGQNATITASANGGTPNYSYSWSTGSALSYIAVSPTTSSSFNITVTDNNGCTTLASTTVVVNQLPVVSFTADIVSGCAPLCVTFTNTSPNTQSLVWDVGDNGAAYITSPQQHCYLQSGTYNVSLSIIDNNGCSNSLTQNNYITVHPNPVAEFIASPTTTEVNTTVYLADKSQQATSWFWESGNENNSSSSFQNPQFVYGDTGIHQIRLIVINKFGCRDTAYGEIKITPDFSIYVPNTFTPNNDGLNETFLPIISGIDIEKYDLFIFDRWGNMIYRNSDPTLGWDGRANGGTDIAQQDTYVFLINTKDIFGIKHKLVGHVNLIK